MHARFVLAVCSSDICITLSVPARQTGRNLLVPELLPPGAAALAIALKDDFASLGHKRMIHPPQRPHHGMGRRSGVCCVTVLPVQSAVACSSSLNMVVLRVDRSSMPRLVCAPQDLYSAYCAVSRVRREAALPTATGHEQQ